MLTGTEKGSHEGAPKPDQADFKKAHQGTWKPVFSDPCTEDWRAHWFLDGNVGTVTNNVEGMTLTAGPEFKNDAHHMVLWTQESFTGDLMIEYDFTRLDQENRCVNILYIQATGSGKEPFNTDISKWNQLREVPSMKTYFNNMNLYHISYAAFTNDGKATSSYIRGRRYLPHNKGLKGTNLLPDYNFTTLFETGITHRITVIKTDRSILMKISNPTQTEYCHLKNSGLPVIQEGRIGLRHMFTRSALYKNLTISTR